MEGIVKFTLLNSDSTVNEIRKIRVLGFPPKCFPDLSRIVLELFPKIRNEDWTVSWIDECGDKIKLTNEEEFDMACAEAERNKLHFIIDISPKNKEKQIPQKEKVKHNAVCDGCGVNLMGYRYKCIQCDDFDICEQCETMGLHPDHFMLRMPRPLLHGHIESAFRVMRNLIKKDTARLYKSCSSSRRACRNSCPIPIRLEDFPGLQNLGDAILDVLIPDPEPFKGEEAKEEKPTANAHADEGATNTFPRRENKLVDDVKDDGSTVSDTSAASQNQCNPKVTSDEWTILDKDETAEVNPAPSALPNSTETNASLPTPTAPTLSNNECTSRPIYPPLPSKTNETYHPNPAINKAVQTLIDMGFSNENNLLTYLVISKNGDINSVIELLLLPESSKYLVKN